MKPRKEAVLLVIDQIHKLDARANDKKEAWHYGLVEIRELLDFIYEGPPMGEFEELNS